MKALVTGATGLVGAALLRQLGQAHVLSRNAERAQQSLGPSHRAWPWQPQSEPAPAAAFDGVEAVFHLAGESVGARRWTAEQKRRIQDSRVLGTRNLVEGLARLGARPRVLVSASAVGYYGNRGDEELDEQAPPGEGFLADVCAQWEAEAQRAAQHGMRVVLVRLGLVMAPRGGALERMLLPFRMGVGGPLGSGKQWMPWVHLDDVVGVLLHAARAPGGPQCFNAVGPELVTNAEFSRTLGRALHRPAFMPVPSFALRIALGEMSTALLDSQRVLPRAAEQSGYSFKYPKLEPALRACVQ